ncbi:MAG: ABC transporter permease [Gordonia sp. (in: high G+C Gram-positive bacteria)]
MSESVIVPPVSGRRGNRRIWVGTTLISLVLLIAVFGPLLAPYDPTVAIGDVFAGADRRSPLGLDYLGSDVASRVLSGGLSLAWMVVLASVCALVVGTIIGMSVAVAGGVVERIALWVCDVLLAFPYVVLVLVVVSMLGHSPLLMTATVSVAFLAGVIRLTRGLTADEITREYVQAARLDGVGTPAILCSEVLPNILTAILVHLGTMLTWAVGIFSALAFLGYGVSAPAADWGLMINENRAGLQIQPLAVAVPMILVAVFAVGANLLADGIAATNAHGRRAS